jgi:hypothetical protein
MKLEFGIYNIVTAAGQETGRKGERITDTGYFIMCYSRKMLTFEDNHKILQYQCMAGEGAIQVCWTHGRWMSERPVWPTCIKLGRPH